MAKETNASVWTITTKANVPVKAMDDNPNRISWGALNTSDSDAYFGHDQSVTTSGRAKGWLISANEGSVEDEFANDEVWIIATAGGKEITIQEVSEVTG